MRPPTGNAGAGHQITTVSVTPASRTSLEFEEEPAPSARPTPAPTQTERERGPNDTTKKSAFNRHALNRNPGAVVNPHYHEVTERPTNTTRHQIMICRSGRMRIGVYAKEGDHAADVDLAPGDMILMYEGHRIEFLEPGTKAIEIKEGPFPETDEADKVDF